MTFTVLIPARLASTRLPNKPLADIAGLPMVVHTARRAALSGASSVVVAAGDARIVDACAVHGVQALLTRADHATGSDRLAEACELLGLDGDDVVVNVQGDEPLIDPRLIDDCAALLAEHADCVMGTAAHRIDHASDFADPNVVKVVCDAAGRAMYFSRAPIPCWRDGSTAGAGRTASSPSSPSHSRVALPAAAALRHIGIYAYRAGFLRRFGLMLPSPLEAIESLEQLRVLWHGERIAVHVSAGAPGIGVDTEHDLERVRAMFSGRRVPS